MTTTVATVRLDYMPRPWQDECHRKRRRFTVLVLHRRAGKTEVALRELVNGALTCTQDLGLFAYVAPLRVQAKAIAWTRLKQIVRGLVTTGHVEVNESELTARFLHNGAVVRLFGADNPDSLRGLRIDDVVLDEVAQMKPDLWYEVVRPALADRAGWALFIGTVKGVDLFSQLYEHAFERQRASDPEWWAALWTAYDTDALPPDEITRMSTEMSEQAFAREMLCDFTARGDDQLISVADVTESVRRVITPADMQHAPRVIGVDPARFGDDESVIAKRIGLAVLPLIALKNLDNMALAARLAFEIEDFRPDAVFIDAGAGAGVIDRVRQLGHAVIEVPFGGRAIKPHRFRNRRAELWWNLREWIQAGGALPNDPVLRRELATPTYSFTLTGQIELESKDDIKKRLPDSGSPDRADAVALTLAAPVQPRQWAGADLWPQPGVPVSAVRKPPKPKEWNPYNRSEWERRGRSTR